MRTVTRNPFVTGLVAVVGGLLLAGGAQAEVTSTNPAGLLIFPKLIFDSSAGQDTILQISNTSDEPTRVRCYLVNANGHCSNNPTQVCSHRSECGGAFCLPGWTETDFQFTLTQFQPIVWRLGDGLQNFPLDGFNNTTQSGQFNRDSNIPPAPEDPFLGELKCFQVDDGDSPVARNDLKGEVTMFTEDPLDVRKYNAIGLKSLEFNNGDDTLCLGGTEGSDDCPEPEYEGCPNVVILNHFFDDAPDPVNGSRIRTRLTLVPCSEDFLNQATFKITVQMLIFNEYEQRLSTSRRIECLEDIYLSDIDTRPIEDADDDFASIFNFAVQGTLAGQTRLRSVQTADRDRGTGIVGVANEFYFDNGTAISSASFNLHQAGIRTQGDIIRAPRE